MSGPWSSRDDSWRDVDKKVKALGQVGPIERLIWRRWNAPVCPALTRCTLFRATPKAPSTRTHACLPDRPVARSPVHSLVRLPLAHSPPTIRTGSVITERAAVTRAR